MNRYGNLIAMAAGIALLATVPAQAAASVGQPAPAFTAKDAQGKEHSLAQYKGKHVVLEWVNFDCPFVKKHYGTSNMQSLQEQFTGQGVVWLSINSSAPGKQGHFAPDRIEALVKEKGAQPSAYLIDESGAIGRAYGAKTTPHMYVIDPAGTLIYAGGIDDKPSTDPADVKTATNYVSGALQAALAGQAVQVSSSQPYGCSVKYAE